MYEYLKRWYHRVNQQADGTWVYRTSPDGDWHPVPQSRLEEYAPPMVAVMYEGVMQWLPADYEG